MQTKHLNAKQLAAELGRSRSYITAMKRAGYVFEFGTTTTYSHACIWLKKNGNQFRASHYLAKGADTRLPKLRLSVERRQESNVGKRH